MAYAVTVPLLLVQSPSLGTFYMSTGQILPADATNVSQFLADGKIVATSGAQPQLPVVSDGTSLYAGGQLLTIVGSAGVSSFQSRTGAVSLSKADVTGTGLAASDVGLGNVNNTSDANKPVSTAAQAALDTLTAAVSAEVTRATGVEAGKAPLASPALTGTPTLNGDALAEYIQDTVAAFIVAGTNITKTYDDPGNTLTLAASGSGGSPAVLTGARRYNVKDPTYGAKGDGMRLLDAAVTSGANVVTSPSYTFVSADVGKLIAVEGAGVTTDKLNTVLQGVISAISSGGAVVSTLATGGTAVNASTTVSAGRCTFGTDDSAAFIAAHNAAKTSVTFLGRAAAEVYMPPGRYVVVTSFTRASYVSFVGDGSLNSIVAPITASGEWMTCTGSSVSAPIVGINDTRWGIEGGNMNCGGSYSASTKPYNMFNIRNGSCTYMAFWDTPATSIPWDSSQDSVTIGWNYVYNYGRCCNFGNPGGSGIGIGVSASLPTIPQVVIGNTIVGLATSSAYANGNNGIFCESQSGTTATNVGAGLRIVDNMVIGCNYGITDAGGRGVEIASNIAYGCRVAGVALSGGTLPSGMPGIDSNIHHNVIIGSVSNSTDEGHGIQFTADLNRTGITMRAKIADNYVYGCYGWGLRIGLRSNDLTGVFVERNHFLNNGESGMWVFYTSGTNSWTNGRIKDNVFANNGQRGVSSDTYGMRIGINTSGLEISGNRAYDDQATKTQTYGVRFVGAYTSAKLVMLNNNFDGNGTGSVQVVSHSFDGNLVCRGNVGDTTWSAIAGTAFTLGASTVAAANSTGHDGTLYVSSAGTTTAITVNGVSVPVGAFMPGAGFRLPARTGSFTATYSVAPTVTFVPDIT